MNGVIAGIAERDVGAAHLGDSLPIPCSRSFPQHIPKFDSEIFLASVGNATSTALAHPFPIAASASDACRRYPVFYIEQRVAIRRAIHAVLRKDFADDGDSPLRWAEPGRKMPCNILLLDTRRKIA